MSERYSRHLVLDELGESGHERLRATKVLVIGAGGLGSPVLTYLASSGIGVLGVVDDDVVDESNLQRQVIHTTQDVGRPKVESAAERVRALNPEVDVRALSVRLDVASVDELVRGWDVVVDATDNFATRVLIERACRSARVPEVYGAVLGWQGQVCTLLPGGPGLDEWFGGLPASGPTGRDVGILAPLPGAIGAVMAAEVIKVATGLADASILSTYDARTGVWKTLRYEQEPNA